MYSMDKLLLFDQLRNYQIQRHDFLNNFQVIRGYLQLNMPEKAMLYIDEIVQGIQGQQEIYQICHKTLVAILSGWFFDLRLKGVEMIVLCPAEMKAEEFWNERWQEEYASQFYGYTKECLILIPEDEDPDEMRAEVRLKAKQHGFACQFRLLKQDELYKQQNFETNYNKLSR